jgi:hypothetical protein
MGVRVGVIAPCVVLRPWSLHGVWVTVTVFVQHVVLGSGSLCHMGVTVEAIAQCGCHGHGCCTTCGLLLPSLHCVWCWGWGRCAAWVSGSGLLRHMGVRVGVIVPYGCQGQGRCTMWVVLPWFGSELWSGPEPSRTGLGFGLEFGAEAEPDCWSGLGFRVGPNLAEPFRTGSKP